MKYPAANVSIKNWNKDDEYLIYILINEFIHTIDNKLYQEYFLNNLFVDSNGDIYKLIGRKLPSKLRQFFSFIPNFCTVELIFKRTEERMSIEEVRQHILSQIVRLDDDQYKIEWIDRVKNASSYEEIIFE